MATSPRPAALSNEGPPYPSAQEIPYVMFSNAALRLFWPLDGVFPTAISVMKTEKSADDREPFFQQSPTGGVWHEIAQLPLTRPKVSSIEAFSSDMGAWEASWIAWHGFHEGEYGDPEYITYGDLSDEDRPYRAEGVEDGNWEEDSEKEFLIRCCEEDRPLGKSRQKLVVTPAAEGGFVTVHDFVSAVHPWLMGLRPDILLSKTVARGEIEQHARPAEKSWMVDVTEGPKLNVVEKQSWIRQHGPPSAGAQAGTDAFMAKIRAMRNR